MFQEFPKGLCKGGIDGEWRIVLNDDEEADARAEGFSALGEDVQEPKKRGRPRKAEQ
ncbi:MULTISPECIES: hypothetical protein [Delftia]|uniref:hypothetical protein n=1 Tax=Delftia TaxID=80865 RepID=UPI001877FA86|nr:MULTISPECIES: hypothetical protein [Delftia]WEM00093.1 hypothetical protein PW274_07345 [Delftia tsuruhatensis]